MGQNIKKVVGQRVSAVVAFSFGAPRTASLWSGLTQKDDRLIVMSPAAVPGTSASKIAESRAAATGEMLAEIQREKCGSGTSCPNLVEVLAQTDRVKPFNGGQVHGIEVGMFLLAASADPERYRREISDLVTGVKFDTATQATIRRLALSFARTVDEDLALPSNSGFRSGMCNAYGEPNRPEDNPLAATFAAQMGPCIGVSAWATGLPESVPNQACLILNRSDLVAPYDLTAPYRHLFGSMKTLQANSAAHRVPVNLLKEFKFSLTAGCSA